MTLHKLICCKCGKSVADVTGKIEGITTWFAVCSECLFNVKGWTKKELEEENRRYEKKITIKPKEKVKLILRGN